MPPKPVSAGASHVSLILDSNSMAVRRRGAEGSEGLMTTFVVSDHSPGPSLFIARMA